MSCRDYLRIEKDREAAKAKRREQLLNIFFYLVIILFLYWL